jgi:hypothetical protein
LEKASFLRLSIAEDEKAILAKAEAGRFDAATFAEAALFASGVLDPRKREYYLKRIDAFEQDAHTAIVKGRTSAEKAGCRPRCGWN